MSFDSIPADLLLKIFDHLPFKDCVRLSGVNRLFREVSEKSINTMRSLEINDDLMSYSLSTQFFPSLLESCSPFLESIKVTNQSFSNVKLYPLTEFDYPKLEHLEITVTNGELTKKLISQNRNVRSIVLYLNHNFEWPEDVVLEKLESLAFHSYEDGGHRVNLSPTLRPLIGNIPNLKKLTIRGTNRDAFELPVEELSQLLATTPWIEELEFSYGCSISNSGNFLAILPTWHLPNLTSLDLNIRSSIILHCFPTSFPRLESFKSEMKEIDDQAVVALSQLEHLRELRLPNLLIVKEKLIEMVKVLPSITVLDIGYPSPGWYVDVDDQVIQALSQLQYLRELYLNFATPAEDKIIDLVTNIPSLTVLKIWRMWDVDSLKTLTDFLESTAALFQRNLEICLDYIVVPHDDVELEQLQAIFEMKNNGGPVVEMDGCFLIRYSDSP